MRLKDRFQISGFRGQCVGGAGDGLVSWLVMRFHARIFPWIASAAALLSLAGARAKAQDAGQSSSQNSSQSSSSQSNSVQDNSAPTLANTPYISVNPLANVRYDNRYDLSLGAAYDHMKAGPNLLEGSNLGGLDMNGSYWLTRNWGIEASGRGYVGTALPIPSSNYLKGAMVKQYFFTGGLEWLGPHNRHGDLIAHAMFGGVYGNFQKDLLGMPPGSHYGFYYNQLAPAAIIGGHMDLARSEHWVFRITPDAVLTHYTFSDAPTSNFSYAQYDVNFAISVGMQYKFTSIKRSFNKNKNWVSGW
jgi:hypothetical protein